MSVFLEWGMLCPQCNEDDSLSVSFLGTAKLTASGTEDEGSHEWGETDACTCRACGNTGKVEDFKPAPDSFETVACLWEAFLNNHSDNAERNGGYAECRQTVISFHEKCDHWHAYALTLGFDMPFDWEWCPFFLAQCINADGMLELKNEDDLKAAIEEFVNE